MYSLINKTFPVLLIFFSILANAQPHVLNSTNIPDTQVSPGVTFKELPGRDGPDTVKSKLNSVALFHLDKGNASHWSYNKKGEESFFILHGKFYLPINSLTLSFNGMSIFL